MDKVALICGITSQDAAYLSELLLSKGYIVIGMKRRSSTNNLWRLSNVLNNPKFILVDGDVTDSFSLFYIIEKFKPDEIYNLAAMSFVGESFFSPSATFDINTKGALNILECIKNHNKSNKRNIKYYFAGSSEQFGISVDSDGFQRETTSFQPQSQYAISKVAGFQLTQLYRRAYGIHASNGILFNHSSPRRGEEFLTRKITKYVGNLLKYDNWEHAKANGIKKLKLGNLNSFRDEGFSGDYVEAMYLMLQASSPDDYVVATGKTYSGTDLLNCAFENTNYDWHNLVEIDENLFRKAEVNRLCGDASKIKEKLGWVPKMSFKELVKLMVEHDAR